MDRTTVSEYDYSDDSASQDKVLATRRKFKKRRGFSSKKSSRAARPATYMGQRSNTHPRSGL